jgi:hypothetical protein
MSAILKINLAPVFLSKILRSISSKNFARQPRSYFELKDFIYKKFPKNLNCLMLSDDVAPFVNYVAQIWIFNLLPYLCNTFLLNPFCLGVTPWQSHFISCLCHLIYEQTLMQVHASKSIFNLHSNKQEQDWT